MISSQSAALSGSARIPGDKSISHRALMLGLLCREETIISGLLEGEDVIGTAAAVKALGARFGAEQDGLWRVFGTGARTLKEPSKPLDMGNSGTSARLLMGVIAGNPIKAMMTGDASLSARPMQRVITPLSQMGAVFLGDQGSKLPLSIEGSRDLKAITYELPVASAQVKSAILLAGLQAHGTTTVIENHPTRDHTEKMLQHFGAEITTEAQQNGGRAISIKGPQMLQGAAVDVPADPSSAAFPVVAALIIPGSHITLPRIGMNPHRTGLYETLKDMGAAIEFKHERIEGGEPVATIEVRYDGPLKGIDVPPERVASMIDEFPVFAVAASCATGTTSMSGLGELRVKESDRLAMMAAGLATCGVELEEGKDSLIIHGTGKPPQGGAHIQTALDHRIAMSFLVLGAASKEPVRIDDARPIDTSFPDFAALMNDLGMNIMPATAE